MEQLPTLKLILIAMALFVASCSNFGDEKSRQASQIERLATSMDQCLENQARSQQQLVQQQQQLEEVMVTLSAIGQEAIERETSQQETTTSLTLSCPSPESTSEFTKMVIGQREQVWLQDLQLALPARIDTGAETASLDAHNIELFERNSKNWVRFEIVHPETGEPLQLERKLQRTASILQANSSEAERRPVIELGISIGPVSQSAEFTLSNRSHLDYQMLVGRNILRDVMIVDVSKEYLAPKPEQQAVVPQADNSQP